MMMEVLCKTRLNFRLAGNIGQEFEVD